jgi:perosamine synthetase
MSTQFDLREPGAAVENGIPLCIPYLGGNELRYVKECIDSNFVSSVGPFVSQFERDFAARIGVRHAIATASGTAALHVALLVAGVQPDDEVVVSTLSFIAPANAIRYANAWPVFVDAEPEYWQMDPQRLADFLERGCEWRQNGLFNRVTKRRVRAILPVHILGHPVEMAPLQVLAEKYSLAMVEDATESLGAAYRGVPVGRLGDTACFSFNGNKVITTGAGGMIVTDREEWARRAKYLTTQAKDDPLEYEHHSIGFNYRLSNLHAAIGCAQLEKLDDHLRRKREIAARYVAGLADVPGITPMREATWAKSAWWMFTILVDPATFGMGSRQLLARLESQRIQARPLWQPLHRSIAHSGSHAVGGNVAERLNRDALTLPSSVGLSTADIDRVIAAIRDGAGELRP